MDRVKEEQLVFCLSDESFNITYPALAAVNLTPRFELESSSCIVRFTCRNNNQNFIVKVEKKLDISENLHAYLARMDRIDLPHGDRLVILIESVEIFNKKQNTNHPSFDEALSYIENC